MRITAARFHPARPKSRWSYSSLRSRLTACRSKQVRPAGQHAPCCSNRRCFSSLSGRAAPGVTAFFDLLDDLGAEGFEIARISRGDYALIDDHFGIFPRRAGVGDVGLDRLERRHPAALRDAGLDPP